LGKEKNAMMLTRRVRILEPIQKRKQSKKAIIKFKDKENLTQWLTELSTELLE